MKNLKPILDVLKVNRIVSVDDEHNADVSEKIGANEIQDYAEIIEFEPYELEYLYDVGIEYVYELYESEKPIVKAILQKIITYERNKNVRTSPLVWLDDTIKRLNAEREDISYIPLNNSADVKELTCANTLWILDKDMNGQGSIYQTISHITPWLHDCVNIFMVFTYDMNLKVLNDDWDRRYSFLIECGFDEGEAKKLAYQFYVICKPSDSRQPEQSLFKESIINAILGYTINEVLINIRKAKNNVVQQCEDFTKKVCWERLSSFRYSLENEGEHNIYKLMDNVINMMEKQQYEQYVEQEVSLINAFKKIISYGPGVSDKSRVLKTLNLINEDYQWNKYQYIDQSVNYGYEDIYFGDVFELELSDFLNKKYNVGQEKVIGVLISQSCDCIVRNDCGKRKKSMMEVLLFKEEHEITNENSNELFQHAIFLFKNLNNQPISYIKNDSFFGLLSIDDAILDLCTFNTDGVSIVLEDSILKNGINILKAIEWKNNDCMYNSLRKERVLEGYIGTDYDSKLLEERFGIKFVDATSQFMVRRIGRLTYNNAHTILDNFIKNIGRVGKESPTTLFMCEPNVEQEMES